MLMFPTGFQRGLPDCERRVNLSAQIASVSRQTWERFQRKKPQMQNGNLGLALDFKTSLVPQGTSTGGFLSHTLRIDSRLVFKGRIIVKEPRIRL